MRQAVLVEPKHIEFREVEAPKASDLKEHQVLLNIKRIGICGSEIHSYHGCHPATFYPVVQGHEYSAVVVATAAAVTIYATSPRPGPPWWIPFWKPRCVEGGTVPEALSLSLRMETAPAVHARFSSILLLLPPRP